MAKLISSEVVQVSTVRSIENFTVTIPDDGSPAFVTVVFANVDHGPSGILGRTILSPMVLSQSQITGSLPCYTVPAFLDLYTGLSQYFHDWKDNLISGANI